MTKKNIYLMAGGAVLAALGIAAALNYPPKFGSDAAQGAIGQRQVYRDNAVTSGDVAVTPGAAPVANQVNSAAKNDLSKSAPNQSGLNSEVRPTNLMNSEGRTMTMQSEGRQLMQSEGRQLMNSEGRQLMKNGIQRQMQSEAKQ